MIKNIKKAITRFHMWFEINCGWFFVNGMKREEWTNYLKTKYHDERSKP